MDIITPFEPLYLSVAGYKSLYQKQTVKVVPLTILAGANSSGKSSFMQPFLLMKQTLEAVNINHCIYRKPYLII
jgi:predicted ATPase